MAKIDRLTKSLAIAGAVLVWLPLLAPLVLGLAVLIDSGRFLFDFLMPAELFPLILAGAALQAIARRRAGESARYVVLEVGAALFGLVVMQGTAIATGLASGAQPPEGWRLALVMGLLALAYLTILILAWDCLMFLRGAFRGQQGVPRSQG